MLVRPIYLFLIYNMKKKQKKTQTSLKEPDKEHSYLTETELKFLQVNYCVYRWMTISMLTIPYHNMTANFCSCIKYFGQVALVKKSVGTISHGPLIQMI